ncbi:hypothetical protein L3Q82_017734, partial [Scortum barcoo]
MLSIVCQGESFLLSLQTPSSLLTAVLSVPPSGPQLKTIKIRWNFLFTIPPQFEGEERSDEVTRCSSGSSAGRQPFVPVAPRHSPRLLFMGASLPAPAPVADLGGLQVARDKSWMHTPEALAKHYIPYNAKMCVSLFSFQFLGNTEVEAPKGTEVVKDAVRKLKDVQHNCQLHRISFCADDKTDKRIFTFICKDSESNKHLCYVFDSEKCAEEITLTIGQAFDLAYKKFLESGGKDVETRKQIGSLQKRIQELETENSELKKQLQDLEEQLMIAHVPPAGSISMKPQSTDVFDMVPFSPVTPLVPTPASNGCPPPPPTTLPPDIRKDLFGAEPFDPFTCGAADFPPDIQSKLDEMQVSERLCLIH